MGILVLVIVVLAFGIWIGFIIGFSRAIREASHQAYGTKRPVAGKIVTVLGFLALVGAVGTAIHTWHFTRAAQRTSGTVIEMQAQTDKENHTSYAPTFRFLDASQTQYTVSSLLYQSPPAFRVGDSVAVLYLPTDPQNARIDTYLQVWGLPSLLGLLGSLELLAGLVILLWPKITGQFQGQTAPVPPTDLRPTAT